MRQDDNEIMALIGQLGGSSSQYMRARRGAVKHLVSEIYSPPRVTAAAKLLPELRCVPGFALDLTTKDEFGQPWNFDDERQRRRAREMIEAQRPMLLIGSPMCTAFSAWQFINHKKRDPTVVSREYVRAMVHIRFTMQLYELQLSAGRYFLHEHPAQATSWAEAEVQKIQRMPGIQTVVGDQCQYEASDKYGNPIKKPTKFMTNRLHIGYALGQRCSGRLGQCSRRRGGTHALCNGETAKAAAIYPFALCRAILTGFRNQMIADGCLARGSVGLNCVMLDDDCGEGRVSENHWIAGEIRHTS